MRNGFGFLFKGIRVRSAVLGAAAGALISASAPAATTFQLSYATVTSGPSTGGTAVVLVGNQFQPGAAVSIGGAAVSASTIGSTRLQISTPSLSAGSVSDVVVSNPGGPTATLTRGWFADFLDVPGSSPFHAPVETISRDGITSGCGGSDFS